MEPVPTGLARVMSEVFRRAPVEESVRLAWPLVCGSTVAGRTRPLDFSRGVLQVVVPDSAWRSQLADLERRYVSEFARVLGSNTVDRIEFVIGMPVTRNWESST